MVQQRRHNPKWKSSEGGADIASNQGIVSFASAVFATADDGGMKLLVHA